MGNILDGNLVAQKIKDEVKAQVAGLDFAPSLAVVIVGNNPASRIYVNAKKKDCEYCDIKSVQFALDESAGQNALLALIDELNNRGDIHGILVQLPLPKGYSEDEVIAAISPAKDVDAFHPFNVGRISIGNYQFLPCTPAGVMELLDYYEISPAGKHCVIVGRSNIVGKPMAHLLLHKHATVTICHSRTPDLGAITRQADILVAAAGKVGLITNHMVKPNAVVIDVAINRLQGGICGDVVFDEVKPVASYITPVPGGVGPMTRAVLMKNTLIAANLWKREIL